MDKIKMKHFLFVLGLCLPLVYQNCAQSPENADELNSATAYKSGLPFAFDTKVDTIGYMSCSDISSDVNPRAYFSFRVGAYNPATGGLSVTQDFINQTTYYSNTDRGRALAESARNSATLLSLSIRKATDLQSLWTNGDVAVPGEDLDAMLPVLESDQIAGPVAAGKAGVRINYFPGAGDKRLLEGSLRFMKSEDDSRALRDTLDNKSAFLVTGYSDTPDEGDTILRSPSNFNDSTGGEPSKTAVYGTGYGVGFGLANGMSSGDRRVLAQTGVSEINLENGAVSSTNWVCAQNYQFIVVRPEDIKAQKANCGTGPDSASTPAQRSALRAIRRVLRVEDWYVDVINHCVVPKDTGDICYGANIGTRAIQYGAAQCTNTSATACPHFVSVCLRQ